MSVGIFIDGRRPKSKKEIREVIAATDYQRVTLENTSAFSNEYDCTLQEKLEDLFTGRIDFVGPDPHTSRNFFGNIFVAANGKVTVK
jgi:hypothetical protein